MLQSLEGVLGGRAAGRSLAAPLAVAQDPLAQDLRGRSLPLRISGPLTAPSVAVDVEQLLKEEATNLLLDRLGLSGDASAQDEGGEAGGEDAAAEERDPTEEAVRGLFNALLGGQSEEEEAAPEEDEGDQ